MYAPYLQPSQGSGQTFLDQGELFLPGNKQQLRLAFIALILNRNILIEDVPVWAKQHW